MTTSLVTASYTRTATGLRFNDDISYEEWEAIGANLAKEYSGLQWAIGDWINYGEYAFGEKYAQALDATNYNYGTLRNYASICARIPPQSRPVGMLFHQIKHVAQIDDYEKQRAIIVYATQHELTGDEVLAMVQTIVGKPTRAEAVTGVINNTHMDNSRRYIITVDENVDWQPGDKVVIRKVAK